MNHISNFSDFSEDILVNEIINYVNLSINESLNLRSIWDNTVKKIKNLSVSSKRKVLKYVLFSLISVSSITNIINLINESPCDEQTKELAVDVIKNNKIEFKSGTLFRLSQEGRNHIKETEKLKLEAYKLGDKKITIGWGHAENIKDSKYKVGDKITKSEAERLFSEDLKVAADGVRSMFRDWEEDGIKVPIAQSMFDALVSIAFNAGVSGLRSSDIVRYLKKQNYVEAGEKIKTFKLRRKYPGLKERRLKESEMFLASL